MPEAMSFLGARRLCAVALTALVWSVAGAQAPAAQVPFVASAMSALGTPGASHEPAINNDPSCVGCQCPAGAPAEGLGISIPPLPTPQGCSVPPAPAARSLVTFDLGQPPCVPVRIAFCRWLH